MPKLRLCELREKRGLNQTEIAKILGCSQTGYSKWELQQRDIPNKTLIDIASFFGTSTDYVLGITDEQTPYPQANVLGEEQWKQIND